MPKVIIDPASDIFYSSFYIKGLTDLLGRKNIVYESSPFIGLSENNFNFNFIFENTKYTISMNDSYVINGQLYEWCDVYGGVNINFSITSLDKYPKLISLVPSFGIKIWNLPQMISNMAHRAWILKPDNYKFFSGRYKHMYLRSIYEEYGKDVKVDDDKYIFFCSTLWYNDEWNKNDEGVNQRRANFIRSCKSLPDVKFEGGLVSQGKDRSSEDKFCDCLSRAFSMNEWLYKTKKSALVFNTPAFWNCHGWKLGEYLALGKAIVSTKLLNDLPESLVHGVNIHYVENTEDSIREAVQYIIDNPKYRIKLENGAKEYWSKYGTPLKSLALLGVK